MDRSILYLVLWFILPIIPAFLLFKMLPSTAWVTGPLKGLRINLSGAFAGYFILFLVSMPVMKKLLFYRPFEVWHVSGKIVAESNQDVPYTANSRIVLSPPPSIINNDRFKFDIIGELQDDGNVLFPQIQILIDGYQPFPLDRLDYHQDNRNERDKWRRKFSSRNAIHDTIKLKAVSMTNSLVLQNVVDDILN